MARRRVVMVAMPCPEVVEVDGALDVFYAANLALRASGTADAGYDVEAVSPVTTVRAWAGLRLVADRSYRAVRGAGANFGVAASLEYRLHPVGPTITAGLLAYPFAKARDVLRFYRDVTASLPDELTVFAGLIHGPDGGKLAAIAPAHCGSLAAGEAAVRSIKGFGAPALDQVGPMSYCDLNTVLDAAFPRGALNYWKSSFLARLSDEAIDGMIERFARCPSTMGELLLEHLHGAATRVAPADTAFPHRAEGYNYLVVSEWTAPAESDARPGRGSPIRRWSPSWRPAATSTTSAPTSPGSPWPRPTGPTTRACRGSRPSTTRTTSST